ncbi:MAG: hypothetical protein ACW98I_19595 [Candidatus Hodarchaeales archaeon]
MSRLLELEGIVKDQIKEEYKNHMDESEMIHSIVDSSIPAYHSDVINIASDNIDFYLTEPEIWAYDGKHTPLNGIVGNLFAHLETIAYKYLEELKNS